MDYRNGYRYWNDYPYFVYNGYLHRYSDLDRCDYELVDGYTNTVVQTYYDSRCNIGYDMCSDLRSIYNSSEGEYRYFCSERLDYDDSYDYNWNSEDDFYSDTVNYQDDNDYDYYDDYDYDENYL